MEQQINYRHLILEATRGVVKAILADVAKNGLPGAHHFFITFNTRHKDVIMADRLRQQYPEEMPVVIQNWFENLSVRENGFEVTLNFNNIPEPLFIPFVAISTFVDPSVEFGLSFKETVFKTSVEKPPNLSLVQDNVSKEQQPSKPQDDAEIISLDSFR